MGRIFQKGSYPCSLSTPKTVFIFGGRWVAHLYSDSPEYNKIADKFQNQPPLLVLTCLKYDDKLNVGLEKIIDECSFALIVDSHWHVLFLTYWPTNRK